MKRISFNELDAAALYEWCLAVRQIDKNVIDDCFQCEDLKKRLEKFLGAEAKKIQRLVKKHPYVSTQNKKR